MATRRARRGTYAGRGGPLVWGLIGVLVLAGLILLVLTIADWLGGDSAGTPSEQFGIGVGEAIENPEEYQDETVTVSGEVNQVLDPFAYTIGGEQFADGHELLIVGPPPPVTDEETAEPETQIEPEDIVQVSGNLRQTDIAQIEGEMDLEIDADIPQELQDQPILVAQGSVVTARQQTTEGDLVEADELLDNPDEYVGETVAVTGDVTDSFGEVALEIDGALLVVDTTEAITEEALDEAETVEASGEVVTFDQDSIQDEVDLSGVDADFEPYQDQPAVVADALQLLPESDE